MSPFDDGQDVWRIPDDRLIAGDDVPGEADLVAFVAAVRATADDPAPAPTAALAALLESGLPTASGQIGTSPRGGVPSLASRRRLRRVGAAAGLVVAGKVALAGAAAAAGIVGVAHLDAAPAVVREPAQSVVHAVGRAWHDITGGAPAPVPASPTTSGGTSGHQPGRTTAPCVTNCAAIPAPAQTHGRSGTVAAPGHAASPTGRPTTNPGKGSGSGSGSGSGKATPAPESTHGSSGHAGNPPGQDHRPTSASTPRSHVPAGRG